MRIAFVSIGDAYRRTTYSGTSSSLLASLVHRPVEIVPIFPLNRSKRFLFASHKLFAALSGQSYIADRHPVLLQSYAAQITKRLQGINADIIFANSTVPIALLDTDIPIVVWTDAIWHNMSGYYSGQFASPSPSSDRMARLQEEQALSRSSAVVYTSNWAAEEARKITDASKVHVVPRGANVGSERVEERVARARQARLSTRPYRKLLFLGIDWKRKGGDLALEVVIRLNALGCASRLIVVGPSSGVPSSEYVECLGYLNKDSDRDRELLCRQFEEADMFLLPSGAEAGGIVFGEACAYGLPSVALRTGGVGEYVRHGETGLLFDPGTQPDVIAKDIITLLADQGRYQMISEGALRLFANTLNWDATTNKLLSIMRSVATVGR